MLIRRHVGQVDFAGEWDIGIYFTKKPEKEQAKSKSKRACGHVRSQHSSEFEFGSL
jgi:hypothetical protein